MAKSHQTLSLFLASAWLVLSPAAFADTLVQMIKKVEKLRSESNNMRKSGNIYGALQEISEAADIAEQKDYKDPNKEVVFKMIAAQLGSIQGAAYQKRDWKTSEAALRKKIQFLETIGRTETDDYQTTLRFLDIVLKAQKKPTEAGKIQAKIRPMKNEAGKPIPSLTAE